ncbi:MAG: VIT1/CCC1 transporter family protein [Kiritimatiellae bacterium]|nr:VIT1/CCC1 transporter family protein [Kiritimatiellia bacterium]
MALGEQLRRQLLEFQRNEITEAEIYRKLASIQDEPGNRHILESIAADERRHYEQWKALTGEDVEPDRARVRGYYWLCRLFGFTFGLKLMERGEAGAQRVYGALPAEIAHGEEIAKDETDHENQLIAMLDEERLRYVGSIVLGLNDALVELTGALAGLTLALQNTKLIALTGSITGIAAALSMAASEYLSTKAEATTQKPLKAAVYTGIAYVFTVVFLILPYLVLASFWLALGCTLAVAIAIIACFNYYISVAKDLSFARRFAEMAGLSLGVAGLSFVLGFVLRAFWGVDV